MGGRAFHSKSSARMQRSNFANKLPMMLGSAALLTGIFGYLHAPKFGLSKHAEAQGSLLEKSRVKRMTLLDFAANGNLLTAGDPSKKAIAVFYDSSVGTHSEYVDILRVR